MALMLTRRLPRALHVLAPRARLLCSKSTGTKKEGPRYGGNTEESVHWALDITSRLTLMEEQSKNFASKFADTHTKASDAARQALSLIHI